MWRLAHTITSQKHDFGAQILLLTENVGFELIDDSDADYEKICYS